MLSKTDLHAKEDLVEANVRSVSENCYSLEILDWRLGHEKKFRSIVNFFVIFKRNTAKIITLSYAGGILLHVCCFRTCKAHAASRRL